MKLAFTTEEIALLITKSGRSMMVKAHSKQNGVMQKFIFFSCKQKKAGKRHDFTVFPAEEVADLCNKQPLTLFFRTATLQSQAEQGYLFSSEYHPPASC